VTVSYHDTGTHCQVFYLIHSRFSCYSLTTPAVISDDNYTRVILLGHECLSIERILGAATRNLEAHCTLALIIPLGYSSLCTQAKLAVSSTPKNFTYSTKVPASAATSATAHCCPVGIARAAPAFEVDAVCVEVDSVGLTVEEMVGRSVVGSPPDPVSPCRLTISTYAFES
jgi:hypothetical protein